MKVALTTDWLNSFGGAERVLIEFKKMFPDAPILTTVHRPDQLPPEMRDWEVRTSFLQKVPFAKRKHQAFLPLMPLAFEQFDLQEFDLVLSCTTACSKGVIPPAGVSHLCYCHTPTRYLWDLYHEYTRNHPLRALIAPVAHLMRIWDRVAADRVDYFVANSYEVSDRIHRHYGRDSEVIYPPVDVDRFEIAKSGPSDYLLVVSRLVEYKRIDLAIEAANLLGRRLIVVGRGGERRKLEALAGPTVEFRGRVSDEEVADLLSHCQAFLFPGYEDFGIAAVEAQAAGRPVVAYGRGGATETVIDGVTGVHFPEQTPEAVAEAIERLDRLAIDPAVCRRNAERFHPDEFRRRFKRTIEQQMAAAKRPKPTPQLLKKFMESA